MKKSFILNRLWLPLLLCLLPLFSHAQSVKINGFTSSGTYNGYPLFELTGSVTSISISSNAGQFDYVIIDDQQLDYNTSSYWDTYTLNISNYKDGNTHKLQLKRSSNDYGICYFKLPMPIKYTVLGNNAYVSSADKDIVVANILSEYEYNGQTYPVIGIDYNAFTNCTNLTSVTIPNSVTYISREAFKNCSSLTSVNFGNAITSIREEAFYGCSSLKSVKLPDALESIGVRAFYGTALTSVTIPEKVSRIYGEAFYNIANLKNVYFYAKNCEFPQEYDDDGDPYSAQRFSGSVENVIIGQEVTKIPNDIFSFCKITSIVIPESVTSIGKDAFCGTGLTSVSIPNSVTTIGANAFSGCKNLTSVTLSNSLKRIEGSTFNGCSGLTSISLPNSLTYIGNYAFYGCSGLNSIDIPDAVTEIGEEAFSECSLISVEIPEKVNKIGFGAFACPTLKILSYNARSCTYGKRYDYNEDYCVTEYFGIIRSWPYYYEKNLIFVMSSLVKA